MSTVAEEELITAVESAFRDVTYPGDDSIVARPHDWEGMEYQEAFRRRHWQEIVDAKFLMTYRLLVFFSDAGFQYYLPAYLIGLIRFPVEGLEWADQVLLALYPSAEWGNSWLPGWKQRMDTLTDAQKRVIRQVAGIPARHST